MQGALKKPVPLFCNYEFILITGTHQVRLVGGTHPGEGRVEVMYDENLGWGTVCDKIWQWQDSRVVCRQLGFPFIAAQSIRNPSPKTEEPHFGQGLGFIWLSSVGCKGREETLNDCKEVGWGAVDYPYCSHSKDVGVICNGMYIL